MKATIDENGCLTIYAEKEEEISPLTEWGNKLENERVVTYDGNIYFKLYSRWIHFDFDVNKNYVYKMPRREEIMVNIKVTGIPKEIRLLQGDLK